MRRAAMKTVVLPTKVRPACKMTRKETSALLKKK